MNYFSNSGWIYPSSGQINRRDAEGYMNKEFGTGRDGGADYVWTDNNRTFRMAAKNGNESGLVILSVSLQNGRRQIMRQQPLMKPLR